MPVHSPCRYSWLQSVGTCRWWGRQASSTAGWSTSFLVVLLAGWPTLYTSRRTKSFDVGHLRKEKLANPPPSPAPPYLEGQSVSSLPQSCRGHHLPSQGSLGEASWLSSKVGIPQPDSQTMRYKWWSFDLLALLDPYLGLWILIVSYIFTLEALSSIFIRKTFASEPMVLKKK